MKPNIYVLELEKWIEKNPLRKWRKETQITIHQAAALLDVSPSAIQTWENGTNTPKTSSMESIKELIEVKDTRNLWYDWLAERPTFHSTKGEKR